MKPNRFSTNLSAFARLPDMCEKCIPLDRAIENFRREQETVDDPVALALIAVAIGKLESEKAALHSQKDSR